MSRTIHLLRVLIASPSDVAAEREAAAQTITELNNLLGADRQVHLEAVRWEVDVAPGIGTDPQTVINRQLPEYDVFLGIMWTRFGMPTPRADSGTLEEFTRALVRWEKNPASMDIKFYFSNAPISPTGLDPAQLAKVNGFKEQLPAKGILYREYSDLEQFRAFLRGDIMKCARDFAGKLGVAVSLIAEEAVEPSTALTATPSESPPTNGEEGLLDVLAGVEGAMMRATEILDVIARSSSEFTEEIKKRGAETDRLVASAGSFGPSPSQAQAIVNHAAENLTAYAQAIETSLPELREAWGTSVDLISRYIFLQTDTGKEGLRATRNELVQLDGQIEGAILQLERFRMSIAGVPALTYRIRRASRRATQAMDSLLEDFRKMRTFGAQTILLVDDRLKSNR